MATKLPKVTQYVKNVGKSIAFATIENVKSQVPGIKSYVDENDKAFKELKIVKDSYNLKTVSTLIKKSNIYEALETGVKNIIEDIKTGNFYNTEREDKLVDDFMMDDDDFMYDDDDDYNYDSADDDDDYIDYDDMSNVMKSASKAQSTVVAKGTELVVGASKVSTKLIMSQLDKTGSAINAGLGSVYSEVFKINKFMENTMITHLENSKKYYEESLKNTTEMNLMIKEMLDMQRNLYNKTSKEYKYSNLEDSMNYDGVINVKGYIGNIKKNIESMVSSNGLSMLSSMNMGGNGNPYALLTAAPMKSVLNTIINGIIPKDLKKSLNSLDKGVSSVFSQFVAKMNKSAKDDNIEHPVLSFLGKIFGIELKNKKTINTANFKKGSIPFDGITRQSIIETIPGYLARIEAALTGGVERHYDYNKGSWRTIKQIEHSFNYDKTKAIANANFDAISDIEESLLDKLESTTKGKHKAKSLRESMNKMFTKIYEDSGYFNPYMDDTLSDEAYKYYGFKSDADFKKVVKSMSKDSIRGLASSNMSAREDLSRIRTRQEEDGGVYRQLFNDAYNSKQNKSSSSTINRGSGLLANSLDSSGHNIFWYLSTIINTMKSNPKASSSYSNFTISGTSSKTAKISPKKAISISNTAIDENGDIFDALHQKKKEDEKIKKNKKRIFDSIKVDGIRGLGVKGIIALPFTLASKLLDKADNGLFKMMFGEKKFKDDDGNDIHGVFEYIIYKIKNTFDSLKTWIKNRLSVVSNWLKRTLKPYWENYVSPVVHEGKTILKKAGTRVKEGLSNTFGRLGRSIKNKLSSGDVVSADEVEQSVSTSAHGRLVTKRGLTMISPGEMIIPASFDKKEQNRMLSLEKKDRNRIVKAIGLNAKGTINTDKLKEDLTAIYNDNTGKKSKNIASGVIGGGVGLLTGVNPILGGLAGATLSILSNSNIFKNILFGKEIDGERSGGVIPKKIQSIFTKALPDMRDFGIAGGVLGLFSPFGILGGAAIGASVGVLKNNEKFNKFIFGDETSDGLISKKTKEKVEGLIKSSAPNMAIGSVIGALAGPFGLIGNLTLGAGLGLVSSTEKFNKVLFGDEEKGTSGIIGSFKNGILHPAKDKILEVFEEFKEYGKKYILNPIKRFWDPFTQSIKNTISSIGTAVTDKLNDIFENKLGLPITDFLQEKLFKPLTSTMFKLMKIPFTIGKAAIAAPFGVLGFIGDSIRMGQIRKGTANNMSASERLAWRDEHKGRGVFNDIFGRKDRTLEQDKIIAGLDLDQLSELRTNSRASLESLSSLQKNKSKSAESLRNSFSNFFNEKGKNRYKRVSYAEVNSIVELAQKTGDVDKVESRINKLPLSDEEKSELLSKISGNIIELRDHSAAYDKAKAGMGDVDSILSKTLGHNVKGRKGRRQVLNAIEAELKARNISSVSGTSEESDPNVKAVDGLRGVYEEKSDIIINLIKNSNQFLKELLHPGEVVASDTFSEPIKKKFFKKRYNADSKESVDAKNEYEASKSAQFKDFNNNETTANAVSDIKDAIIGEDDKQPKKKSFIGKLLGKIGNGIGGIFSFLGGPLSTAARFGFNAVKIAGGISLLGYASEWFKTSIFPKFKEVLFGTKDAQGNKIKEGLISSFGGKLKSLFFGEDGKGGDGVLGWIGKKWLNPIADFFKNIKTYWTKNGGLSGIIGGVVLPKLVAGWGYAVNNIVTPLVALLVKHLPSMVVSLGKAIISGIKIAVLNKGIKRDTADITIDSSAALSDYKSYANSTNSSISKELNTSVTGLFSSSSSTYSSPSSSANSIKYDDIFNANSSQVLYDANGNKINSSSEALMYNKRLLGSKTSTNNIYYDENGNIALSEYDTRHTTDSGLSRLAKSSASGFMRGVAGTTGLLGRGLAKVSARGVGRGAIKGLTSVGGGIAKTAGAALNGLNRVGLNINKKMVTKATSAVTDATTTALAIVTKPSGTATSKIGGAIAKLLAKLCDTKIFGFIAKACSPGTTRAMIQTAMEKIGTKLGGKLAGKALTAAATAVGRFSPVAIAIWVADFISGYGDAHTLLGVAKTDDQYSVGFGQKCLCGLLNVINNQLTFGLLPTETIIDVIVEFLFPLFGLDTESLNAARERTDNLLDEWNKAHPDDTYSNLEDFNDKDKLSTKIKRGLKKFGSKIGSGFKSFAAMSISNAKKFGSNAANGITLMAKAFAKNAETAKKSISNSVDGVKESMHGEYSIFNKKYWAIDDTDEDGNDIGLVGRIAAQAVKVLGSPFAMIGYAITKIKGVFKKTIDGAKDGFSDAGEDVANVMHGDYTIFSKRYWRSNEDPGDNPINKLGSVFGTVSRVVQSPIAMVGYVGSKIKEFFKKIIDGVSDITDDNMDAVRDDVNAGKYSVFSKDYWKVEIADDNPIGAFGKIAAYIHRLINLPILLITGIANKVKNSLSSAVNKVKSTFKDIGNSIAGFFGFGKDETEDDPTESGTGHVYQSDRNFASMKYGNSTIAKSGCAPVAATNLINNVNPNSMDVRTAAKYAERNGFITSNGGTNISYFNDILASRGIGNITTKNKELIMNALKNGNQVVMLGKDNGNSISQPFGKNPHFITAVGIDNKNNQIIVEDPDLPQRKVKYSKDKLFSSMMSSVVTNRKVYLSGSGREDDATLTPAMRLFLNMPRVYRNDPSVDIFDKIKVKGNASDEYAAIMELANNTHNTSSSSSTRSNNFANKNRSGTVSTGNLFTAISELGTSVMKSMYGDAYSAIFGDGSTTSSSSNLSSVPKSGPLTPTEIIGMQYGPLDANNPMIKFGNVSNYSNAFSNKSYTRTVNGLATNSLNNYGSGAKRPYTISGKGRDESVDYYTFLETIISILLNISDNSAILSKILEILSEKLNINITQNEINRVTSTNREVTKAALNELVKQKGSSSSTAKLLNDRDTDYIFSVMAAIARE